MTTGRPDLLTGAGRFVRDGRLPVRSHRYTTVELFLFSAATWNPHRLHYDQAYVRSAAGQPDLLVQGPLQAAHMFGVLEGALADGPAVSALEYRHIAPLLVGEEVAITGAVTSVEELGATVELWVEKVATGERTTVGVARIAAGTGSAGRIRPQEGEGP